MKTKVMVACAVALALVGLWCLVGLGGDDPAHAGVPTDPEGTQIGNDVEPASGQKLVADDTQRTTLAPGSTELGESEQARAADAHSGLGELVIRVVWKANKQPAASVGVHVQAIATVRGRSAREPTARDIPRLSTTGPDGVARLQLPPGKVAVGLDRSHETKRAEIEAGATVTVSFALDSGVDVEGIVIDPFDNPVPGAQVLGFVHRPRSPWVHRLTETDDQGRFRLQGIAAYYQGIGARTPEHGTSDFHRVKPVEETRPLLRLRLPGAPAALKGVVLDASAQPLKDAMVTVGGPSMARRGNVYSPPTSMAATDAQGRFQFEGLRPGEHRLLVLAAGHAPHRQQVQCHAARPAEFTIQLQLASVLRGRILDGDGRPVAKTHVELLRVEWPIPGWARPDAEGKYEIRGLPAGKLDVTIFRNGVAALEESVELPVAGVLERDFVLSLGHVLQGVLVDERGVPLSGWHVYNRSRDKSIPRKMRLKSTTTDKQGRFKIANCLDQPYDLTVAKGWGPDLVPTTILRAVKPDAEATTYKILDDWLPSAVIQGRVFTADSKPAKGARVMLQREGGYYYWQVAPPADAAGRFKTMRLPPGRYSMMIGHAKHQTWKLNGVVVTTNQELMLEPVMLKRREKK